MQPFVQGYVHFRSRLEQGMNLYPPLVYVRIAPAPATALVGVFDPAHRSVGKEVLDLVDEDDDGDIEHHHHTDSPVAPRLN